MGPECFRSEGWVGPEAFRSEEGGDRNFGKEVEKNIFKKSVFLDVFWFSDRTFGIIYISVDTLTR